MKLTWFFSLLLPLCTVFFALAQSLNKDGTIDCTTPTEVVITSDTTLVASSGDYDSYESSATTVMFYKESDKYTFWYKLIVKYDCEITFNIYPTNEEDIYNFFLYKHPGGNFCQGIINRTILPIRANLFKNKINRSGTGLVNDTENNKNNIASSKDHFYFESHHESIIAKAGEVYYLNVYHTKGDDCGHFLHLKACKPIKLQATHKPCFVPPEDEVLAYKKAIEKNSTQVDLEKTVIPVLKIETDKAIIATGFKPAAFSSDKTDKNQDKEEINPRLQPDLAGSEAEYFTITGYINDSKKNEPLFADIKIIDDVTGKVTVVSTHLKTGNYTAVLIKEKSYTMVISALGYSTVVKRIAGDSVREETLALTASLTDQSPGTDIAMNSSTLQPGFDIIMESIKTGENIVMRNIYFHPNTYVFRTGYDVELERLLDFMKINDQAVIEIQGHTNGDYYIKRKKQFSHLGDEWNYQGTSKKLSKHRADVVKKYLVDNGIDEKRILIKGFGGEKMIILKPVSYEESLENMRVEILILNI